MQWLDDVQLKLGVRFVIESKLFDQSKREQETVTL